MSQPTEQRRLLAILIADIVGYSGLMARFEAETFHKVKELQSTLIVPAVGRNRGKIIKYTGDGFIATFPSALDAVRAAVEVQSGAKAASASSPEDRKLNFRIGINVGDVIVVPGDIYGDSVNIAARLQGLASVGGICVSRGVRDTVKGKFEIEFNDLGNIDVKNIPDPVGTYELKYQPIAWTMDRNPAQSVPSDSTRATAGGRRLPLIAAASALVIGIAGGAWFLLAPPMRPAVVASAPVPAVAVPPAPVPPAAVAPLAALQEVRSAPVAPPAPAVVVPAPVVPPPPPAATPQQTAASPSLAERLGARIQLIAPGMDAGIRTSTVTAYLAEPPMRALAVAPQRGRPWRTSNQEGVAYTEERVLSGCQMFNGEPCVLVAVNDQIEPMAGPPWPTRSQPKVTYNGLFDPAQLPSFAANATRADVVGYRHAGIYKAAAIHPWGYLHLITGSPDQRTAEERALAACTADSRHSGRDLPCLLYASGDQVVLPQRASRPITAVAVPAPAAVTVPLPPSPPPAAVPITPPPPATASTSALTAEQSALKDRLEARIAAISPLFQKDTGARITGAFVTEKENRALAIAPFRRGSWRTAQRATEEIAINRTLESCQIMWGEPCVLAASNGAVASGPPQTSTTMPRVTYSGPFDPDKIPSNGFSQWRGDVLGYAKAAGARAVAIHPSGLVHAVSGLSNQRYAEERALAACTADPGHGGRDLPCYLYASGGEVVLPRRLTVPLTPPP